MDKVRIVFLLYLLFTFFFFFLSLPFQILIGFFLLSFCIIDAHCRRSLPLLFLILLTLTGAHLYASDVPTALARVPFSLTLLLSSLLLTRIVSPPELARALPRSLSVSFLIAWYSLPSFLLLLQRIWIAQRVRGVRRGNPLPLLLPFLHLLFRHAEHLSVSLAVRGV